MTENQGKYLGILRSALWGGTGDVVASDEVLRIARQQSTTGLVCYGSEDLRCRKEIARLIFSHEKINSALRGVTGLLKANDIDSVLLKGQGCASYYIQPMLRNCGDIDLYVGEENYEKACRIVSEASDSGKTQFENNKHLTLSFQGVPVELHRVCDVPPTRRARKLYAAYEKEGLTQGLIPVKIGDCTVNTPADTFNALYIFIHFFHHFLSFGVGFRQICDWTMLLDRRGVSVDREKLGVMLESLGLMKPWKTFGVIAVDYLALPREKMPFYDLSFADKAQKVLGRIFATGNFGKNKAWSKYSKAGYFLRKSSSFFLRTTNVAAVSLIFPRHSILAIRSIIVEGVRQVIRDKGHKNKN